MKLLLQLKKLRLIKLKKRNRPRQLRPQQQPRQRRLPKHPLLKLLLPRQLQLRHLRPNLQPRNQQLKNKKLKKQRQKNLRMTMSKRLKSQEKTTHNRIRPPMAPTLLRLLLLLRMPMLEMIVPKQPLPAAKRQKKQMTRPRTATGTQMHLPLMSPTWLKASEHKSE